MSQNGVRAVVVGLWFLAGAAIEILSSWTRHRTAEQLEPGRRARSAGWVVGGFFVRVLLTAGVLVLAFRYSFVSGLAAWLGYYICRMVLIIRLSRRLERDSKRRSDEGDYSIGAKDG